MDISDPRIIAAFIVGILGISGAIIAALIQRKKKVESGKSTRIQRIHSGFSRGNNYMAGGNITLDKQEEDRENPA